MSESLVTGSDIYEQLQEMPKIDLHRHLEGSLRLETLCDIAREHQLDVPSYELEGLRPHVQIMDGDPLTSQGFLKKFSILRLFHRTPRTIDRVTYEAIADAAADNVKYLELRFTPRALAATMSFPLEDVTDWVLAATERAVNDFDIDVRLILSMNRHESVELGAQVVDIASRRLDRGVVGVDLAGDEVSYPALPFVPVFQEARQAGLYVTIHAGEWAGADSIREAIEQVGTHRLGHGLHIIQDSEMLLMARDRDITLELCVTSNLQSGSVKAVDKHPLRDLYRLSLPTTINTDDPRISDVTLTDEMAIVLESMQLSIDDIKQNTINAARAAFLPVAERQRLIIMFKEMLSINSMDTSY